MKKLTFLILSIISGCGVSYGQTTGYIRNDTIKLTNAAKNTTLVIETASRGHNWYLKDVGNGRTQFVEATIADVSHLQDSLGKKANDARVVHNTGNERINGIKTYLSDIKIGGALAYSKIHQDTTLNGNLYFNSYNSNSNAPSFIFNSIYDYPLLEMHGNGYGGVYNFKDGHADGKTYVTFSQQASDWNIDLKNKVTMGDVPDTTADLDKVKVLVRNKTTGKLYEALSSYFTNKPDSATIASQYYTKTQSDSLLLRPNLLTDYIGVMSYGQSNAIGGGGNGRVTLSQKYNSLEPAGGMDVDSAGDYSTLIPQVETTARETPVSGALESFIDAIARDKSLSYLNNGFQQIGTIPGLGSTAIAGLSKGTAPYGKLMGNVIGNYTYAASVKKTFSVPFVYYTQGEQDIADATSYATYAARLAQLGTDISADVKAVTHQKNDIPLIGWQLGYQKRNHLDTAVSRAQYMAGITDSARYIVATPSYQFQYNKADSIHMRPAFRRIYGAYLGLAAKRYVLDGVKFIPTHPVKYVVTGTNLKVVFYTPVAPLVIDTTLISNPGNYGIRVFNAAGTELALRNIHVVDGTTLSIDCSGDPTGGSFSYAKNATKNNTNMPDGLSVLLGTRGNLRDSQGDKLKFGSYPLHNWSVAIYEKIVTVPTTGTIVYNKLDTMVVEKNGGPATMRISIIKTNRIQGQSTSPLTLSNNSNQYNTTAYGGTNSTNGAYMSLNGSNLASTVSGVERFFGAVELYADRNAANIKNSTLSGWVRLGSHLAGGNFKNNLLVDTAGNTLITNMPPVNIIDSQRPDAQLQVSSASTNTNALKIEALSSDYTRTELLTVTQSGAIHIPAFTTAGIVNNNSSGVLSTSTALPSGTTATTQAASDSTDKIATTRFVKAQIANVVIDTTKLQTVANFFPKGDTRYGQLDATNEWTGQQNMGPILLTGTGNGIQFQSFSGALVFDYGSGGINFQNSTGSFASTLLASPTSSGVANYKVYMPAVSSDATLATRTDSLLTPLNTYTTSSTPTIITTLPGVVGTGSSISIEGTNQEGVITLVTGTSTSAVGAVFSVTMSNSFAYPNSCNSILMGSNSAAVGLSTHVYVSDTTATAFDVTTNQILTASTTYIWRYHNGGY